MNIWCRPTAVHVQFLDFTNVVPLGHIGHSCICAKGRKVSIINVARIDQLTAKNNCVSCQFYYGPQPVHWLPTQSISPTTLWSIRTDIGWRLAGKKIIFWLKISAQYLHLTSWSTYWHRVKASREKKNLFSDWNLCTISSLEGLWIFCDTDMGGFKTCIQL